VATQISKIQQWYFEMTTVNTQVHSPKYISL